MDVDKLKAVAVSAVTPASNVSKSVQSGTANTSSDAASIGAAAEQLQAHFDGLTIKSEFRVDYLSGLNNVLDTFA